MPDKEGALRSARFLCGWCYWINNVLYYPTLLLSSAVAATYVIGQGQTDWPKTDGVLPFTIGLIVAIGLNVGAGTGRRLRTSEALAFSPRACSVSLGLYRLFTGTAEMTITFAQLKPDLTNRC